MDCFYAGDDREIKAIWSACGQAGHVVGTDGVTGIELNHANGQMAKVPWFAIRKGDVLVSRVNAAHVAQVDYRLNLDSRPKTG